MSLNNNAGRPLAMEICLFFSDGNCPGCFFHFSNVEKLILPFLWYLWDIRVSLLFLHLPRTANAKNNILILYSILSTTYALFILLYFYSQIKSISFSLSSKYSLHYCSFPNCVQTRSYISVAIFILNLNLLTLIILYSNLYFDIMSKINIFIAFVTLVSKHL